MTRVGYARVSTLEQDPTLQVTALEQAGCGRVYVDRCSGARADRPELAAALDYVRPGDHLVVWRLDRLGRSLPHLLEVLEQLRGRGIGFTSLCEHLDTATAQGQLLAAVLGAFAQFERELIRERTRAGLAAAAAAGRLGGRPRVLTPAQIGYAQRMRRNGVSITDLAQGLSCGRSTIYRALADA